MKPQTDDVLLTGSLRKKLDTVYRKAEYRVPIEHQETLRFRIGAHNAATEAALLKQIEIKKEWAILTPCNPRSQEATREMNLFYYHELRDALVARNSLWMPAMNHDPLGSWPDEPGFLIADADVLWVRELGSRFRQNAYVSARLGEALRLIWLS